MKKIIILTSIFILLIPFLVITIFLKEEKVKKEQINIIKNKTIRVNQSGNILEVPFEEYITGVLAGEMPAEFEIEALKAQAVAARSYVLNKKEQNKDKNFDIDDTTLNQVYLNKDEMKEKWSNDFDKYYEKIKRAVNETAYEYMEYDGEIVQAFFFSTSSGKTENSEEVFSGKKPYLRSVDSMWDKEVSKAFNEIINISLLDFYAKLNIPYQKNLKIEYLEKTSTGRIKKLKINDTTFESSKVRELLNLKSTFFDIKQNDNNVIIETKGYGHGVGMSQYGAQAMSKKGYTYDQILKYYYQGVTISKMKV